MKYADERSGERESRLNPFMQHRRPGCRCTAGRLAIFTGRKQLLISGWPMLEAVVKQAGDPLWRKFQPSFRVLPSLRQIAAEEQSKGASHQRLTAEVAEQLRLARERRLAMLQFRDSFPPEIAGSVGRLPNDQWKVLKLLKRDEGLIQLLGINAPLVYALHIRLASDPWSFRGMTLSGLRQRALSKRLGFPGTEAAAKILRKLQLEAINEENLRKLAAGLANADVLKALSHLPTITADVIDAVCEPDLFRVCAPSLLLGLSENPAQQEIRDLLRETVRMVAAVDPARSLKLKSAAQVRRVHADLLEDYQKWIEARIKADKFPAPPVPGLPAIIEPIMNAQDLVLEGRQQSHCVGGYASSVRQGWNFIYRVLQPERATLSLVCRGNANWEVGQLVASCNRPVQPHTREVVEEWLQQWSCEKHA